MVNRAEIWRADLGQPRGSAPPFARPVVVVSSNGFNSSSIATVVVAVFTSNVRRARAPGNVLVPEGVGGLERDSVVNISQIVTVNKQELHDRLGMLPPDLMEQVEAGLRLALDL